MSRWRSFARREENDHPRIRILSSNRESSLQLAVFLELKNLLHTGSGQRSVRSEVCPRGRLSWLSYDLAKSMRSGPSFLCDQEQLSLIQSIESCHCEDNHSDVKPDGSGSGFFDNHLIELGSPFREGIPVVRGMR